MNTKPVRKAVIAAAGRGTRLLPATKSVPKELSLMVDRPVIQFILEELRDAGITDVLLVTSPGKEAILSHFSPDLELEAILEADGKHALLSRLREVSRLVRLSSVHQSGPYGNGTPVICAKDFVGDEPFLYVFPDDLTLSEEPFARSMVERYHETGAPVIGVDEVPWEEVHKYGVVAMDKESGRVHGIVEKPRREDAPSNFVQFGRFVLTPDIVRILERTALGKGGELWLADALAMHVAEGGACYAQRIEGGKWLTTGDPLNNAKAFVEYALADPNISDNFRTYLTQRLNEK